MTPDAPTKKETNYDYCWIKTLNRLLYDQNRRKCKTYFCDRCLYGFTREDLLLKQKEDCVGIRITQQEYKCQQKANSSTLKKNQNQTILSIY